MIRYMLKCPEGHRFESWFRNAAAYETLAAAGRLRCPSCGAVKIEKSLMAPDVRPARERAPVPLAAEAGREKAIAALKRKVEAECDYVGPRFAREARAIHDGTSPERPIYGEAKPEEAIALIEDGVAVAPLPFTPTRKIN